MFCQFCETIAHRSLSKIVNTTVKINRLSNRSHHCCVVLLNLSIIFTNELVKSSSKEFWTVLKMSVQKKDFFKSCSKHYGCAADPPSSPRCLFEVYLKMWFNNENYINVGKEGKIIFFDLNNEANCTSVGKERNKNELYQCWRGFRSFQLLLQTLCCFKVVRSWKRNLIQFCLCLSSNCLTNEREKHTFSKLSDPYKGSFSTCIC